MNLNCSCSDCNKSIEIDKQHYEKAEEFGGPFCPDCGRKVYLIQ